MLQNDILELIARGETLSVTARALCQQIESGLPGVVCALLTVDTEDCVHVLAAPALPDAFAEAFEGLPVASRIGSWGVAILSRMAAGSADIANDPNWSAFAKLPLSIGLKACWAEPVLGRQGEVLGALALYFRQPRDPTPAEREAARTGAHVCAIAIEREQQMLFQHRLAYRDALSNLPNRAAFNAAFDRMAASGTGPTGLLMVDLDNLKTVNDTFGHRAGDDLIRATARRIETAAMPCRTYRLGGDEFGVLIGGVVTDASLKALADKILDQVADPVDCDGFMLTPCATIGGARQRPDAAGDDLLHNADFALFHGKETLRGGYMAYSDDLGATMTQRLNAVREVSLALREDRIDAHYQPVVRIDTGEIVGLEALFRVLTSDGDILPAADYFQATADVHTSARLTRRMLEIVARDVRSWLDRGIWFQHVGINVSAADFQGETLFETVNEAFGKVQVPLHHVILEVTESVYMNQAGDGVARELQNLRNRGLRVALDDFGTGFASLTHLLSVPVDIIKIDRSFIMRMEPGSRSAALVEGMLAIASKLGLTVVAEGIETAEQARLLQLFGCRLGQGWLYSRAADRRSITRLLMERAEKRDGDHKAAEPAADMFDTASPALLPHRSGTWNASAEVDERVVRYAILLCGADWRVVSERRQFGRFPDRSAAFQCALRLAREANEAGASVELLHAGVGGELRSFRLPGAPTEEEIRSVKPRTPRTRTSRG